MLYSVRFGTLTCVSDRSFLFRRFDSLKKYSSHILTAAISALLAFLLAWFCFVFIFLSRNGNEPNLLAQVRAYIESNAVFDFSEDEAVKAAVNGYLSGLEDDYSYYWTEEEYSQQLSENQGNFSGLGLQLRMSDPISEGIFVYRVYVNSPAEQAGVRAGDTIVAIDGVSVDGKKYDDVYAPYVSGEKSSLVLTLEREGGTLDLTVEWKAFVQSYVEFRKIGDVGFIRLHSFRQPAVKDFESALNTLLSQGVKGFVFDLRNNLGGELNALLSILDLLVEQDEETVVLRYKDNEKVYRSETDRKTDLPAAVLINGSSASASELMASCLRDLNGSLLIGTRSYGKAVGQTTFYLSDKSAVKFTTFFCMTKGRLNYHGVGLEPDRTVELTEEQEQYFYALDETDDPQLQVALSALAERIS